MFNLFKKKKKIEDLPFTIPENPDLLEIPKGWFIYEAGQDPVNLSWFALIANLDDIADKKEAPRHHITQDHSTIIEAIQTVIKKV